MKEAGDSSKEVPSSTCEKGKVLGRPTLFSSLLKAHGTPQPDCRARLDRARLHGARLGWAGRGWDRGDKTNPTSTVGIRGHREELHT